jgi:hypothetical protein
MLAFIDSLQAGTLNEKQRETIQALREAVMAMA